MSEILSPAGSIETFKAAISNGADALYLGLDKFSARAYAENFTLDNLEELVKFAHLRNVKIYVTINTILYDEELKEAYKCIDKLACFGVDAIIVQDLAILTYITNKYKSIEAHASTQMGIDDIYAASLVKDLGVKRIVFARETEIEKIKEIKEKINIEVETFIHGALCLSYSGNCFMSSSIGERSGNRGRCAGCCRKRYSLIDNKENKEEKNGYLLSLKDLNLSSKIDDLRFVDSLKIEGRMKEASYVGAVTQTYRKLLDGETAYLNNLNKVFNRTYTKGFIFKEDVKDISNIEKPNNYGYEIGEVVRKEKGRIYFSLNSLLNKGDQIRLESIREDEEISLPITKLYSIKGDEIISSSSLCYIEEHASTFVGSKVYKTKDILFNKEIELQCEKREYKKIPLTMDFYCSVGKEIRLDIKCEKYNVKVFSDFKVEEAKTSPASKENIINQLSKLNDYPYEIKELNVYMDNNCFIPLKSLNELRRKAIEELNQKRVYRKVTLNESVREIKPKKYDLQPIELSVEVSNEEQYKIAKEEGIKHIYFKNVVRRNFVNYKEMDEEVLVGGLGGISFYKGKNVVVSDYSLNVVNYKSVALLSSLGVDKITLSPEINKEHINQLVKDYFDEYKTYPNLELVVYGREKIMHTRYCPLRRIGMCNKCKESNYSLKDQYASFPLIFNSDCTVTVLNSKTLNLIDNLSSLSGISSYRLRFTLESGEEEREIIRNFKNKLFNGDQKNYFNPSKDTRGHFIKNPL